ncbi:translation initiation factor IF-2-like isoform X2 [Falco naumanni]|uniref:translation initiation factor IF-2-like isoform X2 n=1 Tax=Falco naumanni TaxID=148594 RepID=UPI001ADE8B35|nr:translation initiation factor IF-2-like isoform X2 [Falco naumanni]
MFKSFAKLLPGLVAAPPKRSPGGGERRERPGQQSFCRRWPGTVAGPTPRGCPRLPSCAGTGGSGAAAARAGRGGGCSAAGSAPAPRGSGPAQPGAARPGPARLGSAPPRLPGARRGGGRAAPRPAVRKRRPVALRGRSAVRPPGEPGGGARGGCGAGGPGPTLPCPPAAPPCGQAPAKAASPLAAPPPPGARRRPPPPAAARRLSPRCCRRRGPAASLGSPVAAGPRGRAKRLARVRRVSHPGAIPRRWEGRVRADEGRWRRQSGRRARGGTWLWGQRAQLGGAGCSHVECQMKRQKGAVGGDGVGSVNPAAERRQKRLQVQHRWTN